jgi:intraflagellar transport protein 74
MGRASGPVAALAPKGGFPGAGPSSGPSFAAPPGMRPPTNAGRPGSSAGVPQGMRPPTAGGAQGGAVPVPLNTDIQVTVRPVTGMAAGLNGMPVGKVGDGRKIADKSYYLTELNRKLNDIMRELDAMRTEIEQTAQDNNLYAQLERRYEQHMKEVRVLEGQLADFNLAFDKLRTNTNVEEIKEMYQHLKQRNEHEKNTVDSIFLKCQQQEAQTREVSMRDSFRFVVVARIVNRVLTTHSFLFLSPLSLSQIESKMQKMHLAAADRIASLGEEKQQEYLDLQDELAGLNERVTEREGLLQSLEREIGGYEDTLKSEAYQIYQKGSALAKENQVLARQKQELEDELNSQLSPGEIKDKLTQKIKDATAETTELEKQIKKLEASIEKLGDTLRAKENELQDAKKHSTKAKKYEAIYERDAKMQEFISAFPSVKAAEIENKRKLKEVIVALLKHISKGLSNSANLAQPSADGEKFSELKQELTFKEEKMADSKKTLATLTGELEKRKEELEKIDQLDAKIGSEIAQLHEKIAQMNQEMSEYKSEDELKNASIQAKKDLLVENSRAKKAREAIKTQVALLSTEFERRNKELQANDTFKKIEAWEQKLKTHAGAVFTLQEYINTRKRESDYEGLLKECAEVTKQINVLLIQNQK